MPAHAPAIPAVLAALAATLNPCPGCGALPAACLERLMGPWQDVCCPACEHYPELPHADPLSTHQPAVCAAWADQHGNPRGVACPTHWEPAAVAGERARRVASVPPLLGPSRLDQAESELTDAQWAREHGHRPHGS